MVLGLRPVRTSSVSRLPLAVRPTAPDRQASPKLRPAPLSLPSPTFASASSYGATCSTCVTAVTRSHAGLGDRRRCSRWSSSARRVNRGNEVLTASRCDAVPAAIAQCGRTFNVEYLEVDGVVFRQVLIDVPAKPVAETGSVDPRVRRRPVKIVDNRRVVPVCLGVTEVQMFAVSLETGLGTPIRRFDARQIQCVARGSCGRCCGGRNHGDCDTRSYRCQDGQNVASSR